MTGWKREVVVILIPIGIGAVGFAACGLIYWMAFEMRDDVEWMRKDRMESICRRNSCNEFVDQERWRFDDCVMSCVERRENVYQRTGRLY